MIENIEPTPTKDGRNGNAYYISKKNGVKNNDVLEAVSLQGEIIHFEEHLPSLNEIFLKYTGN